MRFQRLDLNLLVALDALLAEGSVSLAADRCCLSQSAMSSALGRLRDYFGDDLLVVRGRKMVLTARAEELVEPVRAVLEQIRTTIATTQPFDPASSDRLIRIMASDYTTEVLLASALTGIEAIAPNMRFEIQPMNDSPIETLERGLIDLLITIDYAISTGHPSRILFEDDYVIVGWAENPAMARPMTREAYFALGHVTARFGRARVSAFEDWFMRRQKQPRRVEAIAPTFLSMPGLVVGSNRIATMHRRLATRLVRHMPLVVREAPLDIPPIRQAVQWHLANSNDPGLRWITERLVEAARVGDAVDAVADAKVAEPSGGHEDIGEQFKTYAGQSRA
ncbi:LysR family transcriptional regulator [Sphingomonas sp. SUN039]|uniref:LysR family transcriptional regulator n=1 Tax=Sphingomonas sp. SUN039 TaxID=2937787 RepID=UPI0021642716|nr:LysR family transcriptional regulator [Sphingomonas sp. SUN039]UVO54346.1 LysR family transcriptional regulator [Sphingomonas sp. SUN039]